MQGGPRRWLGIWRRDACCSKQGLPWPSNACTKLFLAWGKTYLAACHLALGERTAVLPLCHEAIRLAEETHDRLAQAVAHRTLAEALGALGPEAPQAAERAMLEAIRLQQEIGAKPELARSYVSYARTGVGERRRRPGSPSPGHWHVPADGHGGWDRAQAEPYWGHLQYRASEWLGDMEDRE